MQNEPLRQAEKYIRQKKRHLAWKRVVAGLACVVLIVTTYMLILPAITMEQTAYCGIESHTHDASCYEKRLVCGMEEEESHAHTDSCYEEVLICQKEEHEHTLACFSNPEADVETKADWEKTLSHVELTGVGAEDVIAIAKSQIGYEESTHNYEVSENGQKKGYTRYGAWYGDPYGDWCAMFVSFCLSYANIEDFPLDADCQNWIETLNAAPYQCYFTRGNYDPQPGDLVFFNNDNKKGADHVGIVVENIEATDTDSAKIRTIEENSSNCVQYVTYKADDSAILGYAVLPGNELVDDTDSSKENDSSSEDKEEISSETEELSNEDSLIEEETDEELSEETKAEASVAVFSLGTEGSADATISIHVQIEWAGDAAYTRPESLTVKLLRNGTETGQTLTLSADNDWSSAFTGNFPKYDENGNEITYTVQGDGISDYELMSNDYTETESSVDLTTLELWVPVTELEEGEDYLVVSGLAGKQSLYRAESTVTDGVLSASVTVNEGSARDQNGNTYSNYILLNPEDEAGQSYYLTWKAVSANGGMNLQSNVYTAWNGETRYLLSQSGKLKVTEDGTGSNAIFAPDTNGAFRSEDSKGTSLYLFKKVSLDISSLPASSYTRDYTMVYRYEPTEEEGSTEVPQATTTSVQVTKKWDDEADHSGDSITVRLMRDGVETEQSLTLNEENGWTDTFEDLPIYNDEGTKYVYDVAEITKNGYQAEYQYQTTTVSGDAIWLPTNQFEDGVTYLIVTSALTGDVIGLEGQEKGVAWTSNNKAGTIYVSSSEQYDRYITDEEAQKHTAMQWTAEYLGLKNANQVGSRYVYALKNVQYQKYLKNNGQGDWSDNCNGDATWWYYGYTRTDADGKEANRYPKKNPESDWSYILGSMNDYFLLDNNHTGDGGAQAAQTFYLYRRYEIEEPQLQVAITNSPIEQTSVTVRKEWAQDNSSSRPGSIEVRLLANGEDTEKTLTLSEKTDWSGVFEGLPIKDASGNKIEYTVSEVSVDDYSASYFYSTGDDGDKVVITNTAISSGYVLPETGGFGTILFTLGGLCLIIGSLMYRYFVHRRRERRAGL